MGETHTRDLVDAVWSHQSVWSQTANVLKARIDRFRSLMLGLVVASSVLTVLALQVATLSSVAGRVLALAAGLCVGLVPVVRVRLGRDTVSAWTRARAVSEELKAEVYRCLAQVAPYRGMDRSALLVARERRVRDEAADLLRHTAGIDPVARPVPEVNDVDSYVAHRLLRQVQWYRGRAARLRRQLAQARRAELVLSLLGVTLAAVAAAFAVDAASAWVAVVTTVTAAVSSHVAGSRWEYQLVEYLRTAAELEHLHEEWVLGGATDPVAADRFVDRCEQVVSIQNDGWMAKWTADRE